MVAEEVLALRSLHFSSGTVLQINMKWRGATYKTTILSMQPSLNFYISLGEGKLHGTCHTIDSLLSSLV